MNTTSRILMLPLCSAALLTTACVTDYEDRGGNESDNNTPAFNNNDPDEQEDEDRDTPSTPGSMGGSGGSQSCNDFGDCGGDVTGTWTFDETCLNGETTIEEGSCEDSTLTITNFDYSGSVVTFTDDNIYTTTFRAEVGVQFNFPASCFPSPEDAQRACDSFEEEFSNGQGDTESSCNVINGGCVCDNMERSENTQTGEWITDGSTLILQSNDEDQGEVTITEFQYCQQGNTISLKAASDVVPLDGFILKRQ